MLDDLVFLIAEANLGTPGTNLFKGSAATIQMIGPGPFVTMTSTAGAVAEGTHNLIDLPAYVRPSAQIIVRAETYDAAAERAKAIYELLFPIRNRMVNGTWWRQVSFIQEPFDLGPDANGRVQLAFNISVVKRYSPATSGSI